MSEKQFIDKQAIMYYALIAIAILVFAASIFVKACITSFVYGKTWRKIGLKQIHPNIQIPAMRGNIYSANYELMATSESRYRLFVDFCAEAIKENTLKKHVKDLAVELHKMFPQKSAKQYEIHIMKGWETRSKNNREYRLLDQDVNYIQWKEICQMPYFNQGRNKSGLYYKELVRRIKPYRTLASRTIGDVYGELGKGGKNGLEKYYNDCLSGRSGIGTRRKVYGRYINVVDVKPVVGQDIVTTIDITIQDIAEKALLNKLKEFDAESGTVVVMEVATGEVKAITNMRHVREGIWREAQNYAVSDLVEPGSTFKVVSMMVAIEDGLISPGDSVDTENGMVMIGGRLLKDHNAERGGYGKITASQSIRYSSNIGVARLIEKAYGDKPEKYIDGIYKIGFHRNMDLEIPGYGIPQIRHPQDRSRLWSRTTLPWMSFGYEIQIPPIYILAFFNAIANNGKLLKPIFVREIREGDKIVEKKHTQVINDQICSFSTLTAVRQMLDDVVNMPDGTGKPAHSDKVRIVGKTGTAQISQGTAGYKSAGLFYQVSFCGYFPAENPQYSCIVVMRKPHKGISSGGIMCGSVFKNIAEEIYARNIISNIGLFPIDTLHSLIPILKNGNKKSSIKILEELKIPYEDRSEGQQEIVYCIEKNNRMILLDKKATSMLVPDVRGMGAKNAVFTLESIGLKVNIFGRGTVIKQSVPAGTCIIKGQVVALQLE
ncbi:MAG: penicillin-binding protein [Candidatus Azobacteroides pseudotrichonymphae]|jgi:cell division protein FtsI (penicillin-binding protein 3)|nr:transpeptidase family protein [Bacteroidales bacterium OttesenSCG-928-I14]GMO33676.1 MAG: penicillin-binding protein [Candidatus Azobacteroides pseudotrichonymphae]